MKNIRQSPGSSKPSSRQRQDFDVHLRAYSAAGRVAVAAGAALGATAVMDGQVVNLTASSFNGPTSLTMSSLPSTHHGATGMSTGGSTTIGIKPLHFGTTNTGLRFYVRQKNSAVTSQHSTYVSSIKASTPITSTHRSVSGLAKVYGFGDNAHHAMVRQAGIGSLLQRLNLGAPVKGTGANWASWGRAMATQGNNTDPSNFPVGQHATGAFADGQAGYMAFKVQNGAGYYYGWVRIKVGKDSNGRPVSLELVADGSGVYGAYNATLDGAITAGETAAVPEPASAAAGLALFALGAVGVKEFRRRRKAVT